MITKKSLLTLLFILALGFVFISANTVPARALSGDPLLGQISIFPYNYTPRLFLPCDGRLLPIQQNTALFSLIGNQFGGDGQTTFALPDLRGAEPAPNVRYFIAFGGIYPSDYSCFDYVGEIGLLPYGDWKVNTFECLKRCDGTELSSMQYQVLFVLIGSTYGGNGQTTFKIPNLLSAEPLPGVRYFISMEGNWPPRP